MEGPPFRLPAPVPPTAASARLLAFLDQARDLVEQGQQNAANPPDPNTLAQLSNQMTALYDAIRADVATLTPPQPPPGG